MTGNKSPTSQPRPDTIDPHARLTTDGWSLSRYVSLCGKSSFHVAMTLTCDLERLFNSAHFTWWIFLSSFTEIPFIIIIIINEEIIVAFSPKTTRTRYKVKKKTKPRDTSCLAIYRAIASHRIGVNGQTDNGRTTGWVTREHNACCCLLLAAQALKY